MSDSPTTVHVTGISSATSEKEVRDFFSFCGKISNLTVTQESTNKSAAVTFEKPTAAKTALLLDNTQLNNNLVQVSSAASLEELSSDKGGVPSSGNDDELSQEDKPRARILAEYLAQGYTISDKAVERAIGLDNQHGFSSRFTNALQQFNSKYQATEKAKEVDHKYGVSEKGAGAWAGLNSYFEKAMDTPTGHRIHSFYMQGSKQVLDVHNEARRLADLKAGKSTPEQVPGTEKTKCSCHADTGKCGCTPGKCACADCPKNPESSTATAESASTEKVSDNPTKTKCNCSGFTGACPCEPGKCACADFSKNPATTT